MRGFITVSAIAFFSAAVAGCGGEASEATSGAGETAGEDATASAGPGDEALQAASAAGNTAREAAVSSGVAGAMTATVNGEPKTFYIEGDSNLIDWKVAEDGSTRVEIIGSPVADDWEWKGSMELTFNVSGSTVSDPQIIFRSMGSTDFHRTTSGDIVVGDIRTDGDTLTVSGSFSGTLTYQSFKDIPLEGYPDQISINDGAFFASFDK
ncbi:hypothetical protein ACI5KX_04370 [Erythrobacter sp. GH1-10]|uniref:hypothetical protein n=1 Tax=Erythrobacter sp. GH1-10 TaxID=3349334 RepID=UPI0038783195